MGATEDGCRAASRKSECKTQHATTRSVRDGPPQQLHGSCLVLVLAALVLTCHCHAGGEVGDPHGTVCGVDVLPTRATGPKGVHAQVCISYLDVNLRASSDEDKGCLWVVEPMQQFTGVAMPIRR